jgi:predicted dehydrogenase
MSPTSFVQPALSRRTFLRTATAAAAFTVVPAHIVGRGDQSSPSRKLNLAGIGVGGRGADDLEELKSQNIVALCDVDWDLAAPVFKKYPGARRYRDYRELLDKEKGIDGVVIATPDHTHAVLSVAAMKHGKHVYCEKPLTRTIVEARTLARVAAETKVATQMGNQGMAFEGNRQIKEWLKDGAIGAVFEAHVWSDRPTHKGKLPLWWPQGVERPKDTHAVPGGLDWDLWLGPAPHRPYHPAYAPFRWRGWWDFGTGGLGDMGIHNLAPVFDALELGPPLRVSASSTPLYPESVPVASMVTYDFAPRAHHPALRLHWYDGGLMPPRPPELDADDELDREDGVLLVGTRGTMYIEGWGGRRPRLLPNKRDREYRRPAASLPRSAGHHQEWVEACQGGKQAASHFGFAGPLTEAVLLGTVSVRLGGQPLHWDSANLKVTNLPEANQLLHYDYRPGWSL